MELCLKTLTQFYLVLFCHLIWPFMQIYSAASCPALEMGHPKAEENFAKIDTSLNSGFVDVTMKFEDNAEIKSISAYIKRASSYIIFGIMKQIGDINDCRFEVIDTWWPSDLTVIGWQTLEVPPTKDFLAGKGHYFGWFDPTPGRKGAISFNYTNPSDSRVCVAGGRPAFVIGNTYQYGTLLLPGRNRITSLKLHYEKLNCEMGDPGSESISDLAEVSASAVVVDKMLWFEHDSWVKSISAYFTRASGHVTFGIFKLFGDSNACNFQVIDTWTAETLNQIGWQTINLPPNKYLNAKKGHYFGWYDPVPSSQGAIGYRLDGNERICSTGGQEDLTIGSIYSLASPKGRVYGIQLCFKPNPDSISSDFTLEAGWILDGFDLTPLGIDASSRVECSLHCLKDCNCKAFVFASRSPVVDQKCFLKSDTSAGAGAAFHVDSEWDYWERNKAP